MQSNLFKLILIFLISATGIISVSFAQQYNSTVILNGSNENPPTNSTATGTAQILIDTTENTLNYYIEYTQLEANETGAHIHGPATESENAGIIFNITNNGSPKTGVWNYSEEMEEMILSNLTYINIHSQLYPAGEIRGQIQVNEMQADEVTPPTQQEEQNFTDILTNPLVIVGIVLIILIIIAIFIFG